MSAITETYVLTKQTGWYGAHSGYYERTSALLAARPNTHIIAPSSPRWLRRLIGRAHSQVLREPTRDQLGSYAELRLRLALMRSPSTRGLILNLDDHLPLLRWWSRAPRRLVGVVHLPPSSWSSNRRSDLARLSSAIAPWRAALPALEALMGSGRARFVPHGIDPDFFCPGPGPREPDHLLLCGQYLRDFARAERVFKALRLRHPTLRFTLVVPAHRAQDDSLAWCSRSPGVTLASDLSDEELLALYQRCTALLLPLKDSGANNTLLEALACGLPIATNDVGGARDYGGGDAFPLAAPDDDASLVALVETYLVDSKLSASVSARQRTLAETFRWETILPQLDAALEDLTA